MGSVKTGDSPSACVECRLAPLQPVDLQVWAEVAEITPNNLYDGSRSALGFVSLWGIPLRPLNRVFVEVKV